MAIDNPEKRKSISGINYLSPGVTPNSGQDQEWRQEAGYGYSGILADSPPAPGGAIINQLMFSNVGADLYNGTLI